MKPVVQIISAPSVLGLHRSGVELLAEMLLARGLETALQTQAPVLYVRTLNDQYSDYRREPAAVLNERPLAEFSTSLLEVTTDTLDNVRFPLILGGDCSVLIGPMAALKSRGKFGLIFIDAHADYYEPHQSLTGEAADMDLGIVMGKGPESLSNPGIRALCRSQVGDPCRAARQRGSGEIWVRANPGYGGPLL